MSSKGNVTQTASEANFEHWQGQMSHLQGRILTIIDASYTDPVQRKAVKDLVRQQFQELTKFVYENMVGVRMLVAPGEETP